MEDVIYKAILVRTPNDNPGHSGLFDTNLGKLIFRDGKWLATSKEQEFELSNTKELYWHKKMTKDEYLNELITNSSRFSCDIDKECQDNSRFPDCGSCVYLVKKENT